MPKYLIEASYTREGIEGVMRSGGSSRVEAVRDALDSVGGELESFHFAFGDHDAIVIVEAPDNEAAAAVALTVNGSAGVSARTTVLLTPEEVDAAVERSVAYAAPGA
jgi:uncharacterized protein with GYD domain